MLLPHSCQLHVSLFEAVPASHELICGSSCLDPGAVQKLRCFSSSWPSVGTIWDNIKGKKSRHNGSHKIRLNQKYCWFELKLKEWTMT